MSTVTDFFSVWVISLPEREDRRRAIRGEFMRNGIDPSQIRFFDAIRPESSAAFPSIGARGCFLSHLEVMRSHDRSKPLLVCEDDLDLDRSFSSRIGTVMRVLSSERWDIFYGGAHLCDQPSGDLEVRRPTAHLGQTHMIAYRPEVLPRVIDSLAAMLTRPAGHPRGPMHVDLALSHFREDNPDVVTRVAVPSLGNQRASMSDIQRRGWHDRLPVIRAIAPLIRSGKNWLHRSGLLAKKPTA